jgi:hypothetical protein
MYYLNRRDKTMKEMAFCENKTEYAACLENSLSFLFLLKYVK